MSSPQLPLAGTAPRIFIAYRRVDSGGYARSLATELRTKFGEHNVFLDVDRKQLPSGVDYIEVGLEKVRGCDVVLAVVGKQWAQTALLDRLSDPEDLVRTELITAREHQIRIIPVLVGGAIMPSRGTLPAELAWFERLNAHEISDSRWDYDVGELAREIQVNVSAWAQATNRSPRLPPEDPPNRGDQRYHGAAGAGPTPSHTRTPRAGSPRLKAEKETAAAASMLFFGVAVSVAYGVLAFVLLYAAGGRSEAQVFLEAYTSSFKTVVSLGVIVGTALIIYRSQYVIPSTIEAAFSTDELDKSKYSLYRKWFYSRIHTVLLSAALAGVAFVLFSYCQFPLSRRGEILMVLAACIQYALGVYAGRKLWYAGMMLRSLLATPVTRNLYRNRELDDINWYMSTAVTLVVVFVYIHFTGYYHGPFMYNSVLGKSIRTFLLLPGVIAIPALLILNFYPRAVLRRLYSQSIDVEMETLQATLKDENLTRVEKRSHLMQVDKMLREELRHSLQFITLSDLFIGSIILVIIIQASN